MKNSPFRNFIKYLMIVSFTGFFVSFFFHYNYTVIFMVCFVLLALLYVLYKYINSKNEKNV